MSIFYLVLYLTALLCSLVAGFLFAFAIVVMPGIKQLNDREFIRAFKAIDRIIQDNHPIFMLVWIGSVAAILVVAAFGVSQLSSDNRLLLIAATLAYLAGVQLPTMVINIPLNKRLQTLDIDAMDETAYQRARKEFEPRWIRWNSIRTALATLTSALLLILLFRL